MQLNEAKEYSAEIPPEHVPPHNKMQLLEEAIEQEETATVMHLMEDCTSLGPFSSYDIAEKFFDLLQEGLPEGLPILGLTTPEQVQINIQWLLRGCLPPNMEKCPVTLKLLANSILHNDENDEIVACLVHLAQDYFAGEGDLEQALFDELICIDYSHEFYAQMVKNLAPHVTTLDEKRESPTLKMRLLEWLMTGDPIEEEALTTVMEDCSLLGSFSSVENANKFMNNEEISIEEIVTLSHSDSGRTATNIQWLLGCVDQITENPEEREFRKASIIMRAMFHNHTDSAVVAYLSSLLAATSLTPQLLASIPQFADSTIVQQVFSYLPEGVQDSFARDMTEAALRAGYCNIAITLLNMHPFLYEKEFLVQMKEINDKAKANLNARYLMYFFLCFKLGEETHAQLQENLDFIQSDLITETLPPNQPLTIEAEQIILGFFAISREMRHIEVTEVKDDQGQTTRVGEFKKEPMIEGESFLAWAIARADAAQGENNAELQDYYHDLARKLYLAGASTEGLEDHPYVEELKQACNSFDVVTAETMTTLKSELPNMPAHLVEIIAAQSQPALPVGNFGREEKAIQRCLDDLKRYIPLRQIELQLVLENKERDGLAILEYIRNATTLQEILREIDYYSEHYDGIENSPIADAVIPEKKGGKNETDEITLAEVLNELQGYIIHLRNECGSVPRSRVASTALPQAQDAASQGMEEDDDGRPPVHAAASLHVQAAESKDMEDDDDGGPEQASEADADKAASHGAGGSGFFSPQNRQNKRRATEDTALPPGPSKHIKTDP